MTNSTSRGASKLFFSALPQRKHPSLSSHQSRSQRYYEALEEDSASETEASPDPGILSPLPKVPGLVAQPKLAPELLQIDYMEHTFQQVIPLTKDAQVQTQRVHGQESFDAGDEHREEANKCLQADEQ